MRKNILFFCLFFYLFVPSQNKIDRILDAGIIKDQPQGIRKAIEDAAAIIKNEDATDIQRIRAYNMMNNAYFIMGETPKALNAIMKARELSEKIKSPEYTALSLSLIAQDYRQLCLNEQAVDYYNQALRLVSKINTHQKETVFLAAGAAYEIGNIEYANENDRSSLKYYQKSIQLLQDIPKEYKAHQKFSYLLANNYLAMGKSYIEMKKNDSVRICYNKARDIIYPVKDKILQVYLLKSYGELYFAEGNYKAVIDSAGKAENIIFFDGFGLKSGLYELLAKSYAKQGDHLNSEKYYHLLENPQKQRDHDLNNATSLAFTNSKKEMLHAIDIQENWKYMLIITIVVIILAAGIVILILRKRALKNKNRYQQVIENLKQENELKKQVPIKNSEIIKSSSSITEKTEKELLTKLSEFENSKKIVNKNLTIASLAFQLGTNTTYLSEVINKHKNKNFNSYVNDLKIGYIINKIYTDPKYHTYKITYLADECGLPYSSFVSAFKEYTGMTPSVFIKQKAKE